MAPATKQQDRPRLAAATAGTSGAGKSAAAKSSTASPGATELSPADRKFGYAFGCEGLTPIAAAMERLGGISRDTIDRRCSEGLLRKGKHPNSYLVMICSRSLREYLARMEQ